MKNGSIFYYNWSGRVACILILIILLLGLVGCTSNMNYIARYDIGQQDFDSLYKNMSEKQAIMLLGLPHRSDQKIPGHSSYDFYNGEGVLRIEFYYYELDNATFFGQDEPRALPLSEEAILFDSKRYLKKINNNISIGDLDFIVENTNSVELQEKLGPPHKIVDYDIGGLLLNAFVYEMPDGDSLFVIYKPDGEVAVVQIQNKDGEVVKDIIKFDESI